MVISGEPAQSTETTCPRHSRPNSTDGSYAGNTTFANSSSHVEAEPKPSPPTETLKTHKNLAYFAGAYSVAANQW